MEVIARQTDWERQLLGAATDCGVALSHEAVSSQGLSSVDQSEVRQQ